MKLYNKVNQTSESRPRESSVGPTNCIFVFVCIHTSQSCSKNTVWAWAKQDHVRATFSNQSTWLDEKVGLTPLPKSGLDVIGTGAGTSAGRTSYRDLLRTLWRNPTFQVSLNSDRSRAHCSMAKWDEWKMNKNTELKDEYREEKLVSWHLLLQSQLQRQCESIHPAPLAVLSDRSEAQGSLWGGQLSVSVRSQKAL